jgi:hypothetical protein
MTPSRLQIPESGLLKVTSFLGIPSPPLLTTGDPGRDGSVGPLAKVHEP